MALIRYICGKKSYGFQKDFLEGLFLGVDDSKSVGEGSFKMGEILLGWGLDTVCLLCHEQSGRGLI